MIPHKNNNGKDFGLGDRLAACIERVGSKRAMCSATLISEAQLFRYLNRETDVPSDKLVAIAKAANVDAGWLLTGEGATEKMNTELRPSFRPELMVQIVQVFEELLVEFEKSFNPRQRARAMTYIYNAMRHEETMRGGHFEPQKFDLLKSVNFLSELRTEEELEIMLQALDYLEYTPRTEPFASDEIQLLRTWCNLLVRGMKGYYSSYAGQSYFERQAGGQLEPEAILELQNLVLRTYTLVEKNNLDWLDMGCGNGRHLAHMAKHMPNINLHGIELSQLGYNLCQELIVSEKLPKGSVTMGDMRQLPYARESMDVVFAHKSLHCLPYVPGSGIGLEESISEVHRVLRPKGVTALTLPAGNWRDYSMPRQFMDDARVRQLAKDLGFNVIDCQLRSIVKTGGLGGKTKVPANMTFAYNDWIWVLLQKQ